MSKDVAHFGQKPPFARQKREFSFEESDIPSKILQAICQGKVL